jgi:hypothetical protein
MTELDSMRAMVGQSVAAMADSFDRKPGLVMTGADVARVLRNCARDLMTPRDVTFSDGEGAPRDA